MEKIFLILAFVAVPAFAEVLTFNEVVSDQIAAELETAIPSLTFQAHCSTCSANANVYASSAAVQVRLFDAGDAGPRRSTITVTQGMRDDVESTVNASVP